MMRPWGCAIFALVCLSIVSLGTSADAQDSPVENLRAGLLVGVMPFFIAKQNGYFAQQQMDVEVVAGRGNLCTMGLIAGSFQFTFSPSTFDARGGWRRLRKGNLRGGEIPAASLHRGAADQEI